MQPESRHPIFAAGLHVAAVGLAIGAATLIDSALRDFAWFLGSFAVTLIYLMIASAELAISVELNEREIGLRRARGLVRRQRQARSAGSCAAAERPPTAAICGDPGGEPGLGMAAAGYVRRTRGRRSARRGCGAQGEPIGPMQKTSARARIEYRRAPAGASWEQRCAVLFEDLRKPARVMVARAYGGAISAEEVEDVYANAWASTLAALRGRERRMDDDELRSYLLTAVANHASKEMRRRSRRPTSALDETHSQTVSDSHQPSPEERAVGNETGSVTRDVLSSLPPRRRAVILLRYGWGLEPKEICSLVRDLSPRAYRKEITRGIEQMIERLKQADSGEWCRSREPILRDYVAGTATEEARRQAVQHIDHCRHCTDLVARLHGSLHELGSAIAWTSVAGTVGEGRLSLSERAVAILDRGRETVDGLAGRVGGGVGEAAGDGGTSIAAAGGGRGAGAAGAGALAKLAGLGAAGKAAVACLSAGVAATACVAAGVVPGVGIGGGRDRSEGDPDGHRAAAMHVRVVPNVSVDAIEIAAPETGGAGFEPGGGGGRDERRPDEVQTATVATAPEGAPGASPAPGAPPEQQEFGLPAAATASRSDSSASSGGGSGGAATGAQISKEFGP